jgi:hypothetical protein
MPAANERQRRLLYATKGEAWVKRHHFDRLAKAAAQRPKKGRR